LCIGDDRRPVACARGLAGKESGKSHRGSARDQCSNGTSA
jgi:hypothetical protein